MSENSSYLARVFDLLDVIVEAEAPISVADAAAEAGVPQSSAFRLVTLLEQRQLVRRVFGGSLVPGSHLLHLGLRAFGSAGATADFERVVAELGREVGESVSIGLLNGDEIVLVARHEASHALRVVVRVGDIVTPSTSAMGKSVLAASAKNRRAEILRAEAVRSGAEVDAEHLDLELALVRSNGYSVDEETYAIGQRCRAVPFVLPGGVVGAISVAGPAGRFTREIADATVDRIVCAAATLGTPAFVGAPVGGASK